MKIFKNIILICIIYAILSFSYNSFGKSSVMLQWNPSLSEDIVDYKIYYGTSSLIYTNSVSFGTETNGVISGLESGTTYYFSATSTSSDGNESDFSNEVYYKTLDVITNLFLITNSISITNIVYITNIYYTTNIVFPVDDGSPKVYIGVRLDYGTDLLHISSERIGVKIFTNPPPQQFYRTSLIITNKHF